MNEFVKNDKVKKWEELKNWLKIQDDSSKGELDKFELVLDAIKAYNKNWFKINNLLGLFEKIKECKISVTANNVHSILTVFKNQNQDLKFNNISKYALELITDVYDDTSNNWNGFYDLLKLLIDNINKNEADNLFLSDVLEKINSFTIPQMTNLLKTWNKKDAHKAHEKKDVVTILNRVRNIGGKPQADKMAALLEQLNKIYKLSHLDSPQGIPSLILGKIKDCQEPKFMGLLAEQLKDCFTVEHATTILDKTSKGSAKYMCKLIEQLPLEKIYYKQIFDKLSKSKAGDLLKLVEQLNQKIGFKFNKDRYKEVLEFLSDGQTVDDICNLLGKLKGIGVTLETNLVHDIVKKLKSDSTVDDICNLLGKLKGIDVTLETNLVHDIVDKLKFEPDVNDVYKLLDFLKGFDVTLGENTAVCIVNKLESVDDIYNLLVKLKGIGVTLETNVDGKNNVADAIVKKFKSPQNAQNLLDLVETLRKFNIQPMANTCKQILNLLGGDQNAGNVADLLISLGNLVGFEKIQKETIDYLLGVDDILKKIATNQSEENMVKLAEVLIAMGKNLSGFQKYFKDKLETESNELKELLTLKYGYTDYNGKRSKFVEKFTQKIEPKKYEKKNEFKQEIKPKKYEKKPYVGQILNSNSQNNGFDPKEDINLGNIEKKPTNKADNKKAVLKILGGIFAILGILCIISSLIISESVLLGLLIPGCSLLTAGIISILVGLFWNNKNYKPPIGLSIDDRPPKSVIPNPDNNNNIESSIHLGTNQDKDISQDDNEL